MMSCLWNMSDATYRLMQEAMDPHCSQLDELSFRHGKETECTWDFEKAKTEAGCMLSLSTGVHALTKARRSLEQWMWCMSAVCFNGGRYDLQLIKPYLAAVYGAYGSPWLRRFQAYEGPELSVAADTMSCGDRGGDRITSILKKGSRFTAIYTHKLGFLDVCNYLPAGGISYAKYLRTYGGPTCQDGRSFFSYEYVDDLAHLRDPLPSYVAFYSSLRGENTMEEGLGRPHGQLNYAELCRLWVRKGMTSLRDLQIRYNNCDVVPFLTALQEQCDLYKQAELDLLKDGPSLPSIGIHYGMLHADGLFYMFHPDQTDFAERLNKSIVGGPSIVFKQHAEVGHTAIRESDYGAEALPCHALFGFDANSLYPWGMAQDMPIGNATSGVGLTSRWTMVPWHMAMDCVTAGPPSNSWPTRRMFAGWQVCCMPAMDLRCDWACVTCPWIAITRTPPPCSSSMAVCIMGMIVASFRTHGSALLPRRDGSQLTRTRTTWGLPMHTHSSPSGSASGKSSSLLTLVRPVFSGPGCEVHPEATGRPPGPVTGLGRGIYEAADDQCVQKMLWEQGASLADVLLENASGQQGLVFQALQGH